MPNAHFRAIFEMPEMRNMLSKTKGNEESRVETGASFGNGIIPLHEAGRGCGCLGPMSFLLFLFFSVSC